MKRLCPLIFAFAAVLLLTSCRTDSGSTPTTLSDALAQAWNFTETDNAAMAEREATIARLPRERTLFLVGFQWGTPFSFNPLGSWPDWPVRPEFNLMYEQLTVFNSMTNEIEPLLGRIEQSNNYFVSVILNPAAKWSDGRRLTAADVIFTYNLNLTHSDAPASYIAGVISHLTVDTVKTALKNESGDSVGVVQEERIFVWVDKEDRNNPLSVLDLISTVPIWPQHVFEPLLRAAGGRIADVVRDPMSRPQIISGPFNYHMHSNEKIVLRRRDDYWGNAALRGGRTAAPEFIIHPIFKGNEHASAALRRGELDISSNFIPRVWRHETVHTWFDGPPFFKPGAIPMFIINATRPPLDCKHFRRAMAFAINYEDVKNLAVSGYSTQVMSGLIMPFSAEAQFFNEGDIEKYGATRFDPEAARRELELGGFKPQWDRRGNLTHVLNANGDTVPSIGIMSPSGWTDFESVVRIAVDNMRSVGIDVRPSFVDASRYFSVKETGDFDLLFDTPASMRSKSTPWARFEVVMSTRNFRPVGQRMQNNTGRWNDPASPNHIPQVDSLLQAVPLMTDDDEIAEAYRELNRIFMQQQPTIPVVYRPEEFYSFSTKWWTNFPTESNPYAPPRMPVASAGIRMLWEIVPTGGR